jgi:hypothetical protein
MQNNSVENPSFILLLLSHHPKRLNKLQKNPQKKSNKQTKKQTTHQTNKQTNKQYI